MNFVQEGGAIVLPLASAWDGRRREEEDSQAGKGSHEERSKSSAGAERGAIRFTVFACGSEEHCSIIFSTTSGPTYWASSLFAFSSFSFRIPRVSSCSHINPTHPCTGSLTRASAWYASALATHFRKSGDVDFKMLLTLPPPNTWCTYANRWMLSAGKCDAITHSDPHLRRWYLHAAHGVIPSTSSTTALL